MLANEWNKVSLDDIVAPIAGVWRKPTRNTPQVGTVFQSMDRVASKFSFDTMHRLSVEGSGIVVGRKLEPSERLPGARNSFWPIDTTYCFVMPWSQRAQYPRPPLVLLVTELSSPQEAATVHTGVPGLNRNEFAYLMLVDVPTLPEQRRIAEILDTADRAIGETEALISKLKHMKTGLMHDLLTRGLDERGQLRDPDAHPEQFKETPLGRIPREWESAIAGSDFVRVADGIKPGPFGSSINTVSQICIRSVVTECTVKSK